MIFYSLLLACNPAFEDNGTIERIQMLMENMDQRQ